MSDIKEVLEKGAVVSFQGKMETIVAAPNDEELRRKLKEIIQQGVAEAFAEKYSELLGFADPIGPPNPAK